jgi:UDP-glucose 4-epimerase
MRALITGGAGFIGSHLADALLARGDSVLLLDNLSTGRLENIEHLRQRDDVEFVLGSILNADLLDDLMARADTCFHLAAAVGVQLIVEKPLESLATNIRGSEVVFEKAHKYGTKVLVTSTSEIYGKNVSDRLGEEDDRVLGSPLKSRWSYSEAKAIEEAEGPAHLHRAPVQHGRAPPDRSLRDGHPALRQPGHPRGGAHGLRRRTADAVLLLRR